MCLMLYLTRRRLHISQIITTIAGRSTHSFDKAFKHDWTLCWVLETKQINRTKALPSLSSRIIIISGHACHDSYSESIEEWLQTQPGEAAF